MNLFSGDVVSLKNIFVPGKFSARLTMMDLCCPTSRIFASSSSVFLLKSSRGNSRLFSCTRYNVFGSSLGTEHSRVNLASPVYHRYLF